MRGFRASASLLATSAALLLGVLALLPAQADVIYLNTGGLIRGEIVDETEDEVVIKTLMGTTTVFREDIERIEVGKTPKDLFEERWKELAPTNGDGFYELAEWAGRLGLDAEKKRALDHILQIQPDHFSARLALGFVLRKGEWVTNEHAAAMDAELVVAVPGADKGAEQDLETAFAKVQVAPGLQKSLKGLRKALMKADPGAWASALEGLAELPARHADAATEKAAAKGDEAPDRAALEEEANAAIRQTLVALGRFHRRGYERRVKWLARHALANYDKAKYQEARQRLLGKWVEAKDIALETIFDLKIYPDENHGRVGQPIVDEKVKAVREAWVGYDRLLQSDLSLFTQLTSSKALELNQEILLSQQRVGVIDQSLTQFGGQAGAALTPLRPVVKALLTYRAGNIDGAKAMRPGLNDWEIRLLERLRDLRIEEHNDGVLAAKKAPDAGQTPTRPEREQVRITNRYRMLMGRHSLEIHVCLVETARGHSNEMTRLGYFAHESPVAERKTPTMRARLAGYPGGAAENISMGSVSPQATHDAWYNSSGHHRNILGRGHQCMGAGQDGQHWTQNFGSIQTFAR